MTNVLINTILCLLPFITVPTATKITDGPYIFHNENSSLNVLQIQDGILKTSNHQNDSEKFVINTLIPSVPIIEIESLNPKVESDYFELPKSLLALSDLEGNLEHLLHFLQIHKIIDQEYNWSWGQGHLVFNGDSVDRGDKVTELLWFIRKIQQQAKKAGGEVHFILGNHDIMIMANDIRYVHTKYKIVSEMMDVPYHEMFGPNSVLGKWLRHQNSIVQIGPYIFVHAGYSPELLKLNLTHTEINNYIRASIGPPAWPNRENLSTSLAWHNKGPLWYRGYFEKHSKEYGPKPTKEEIESILTRHNAKAIIVGHTVTKNIGYLDGHKHLIGIDVHWDTIGKGEGLLITSGKVTRLLYDGTSQSLVTIDTNN